jgi:hypothetical protein
VVAFAALTLASPPAALAAGTWARPVQGAVALAYGQTWVDAQGRSCTHGGLDLLAATGTRVGACGPGEVVFAGLVPAGEGARAYAVTVLTADGLRVTYLPLAAVSVNKGQKVSAGDPVGALAAAGDGSSSVPHLHLGVKRGGTALDPASFLAAPAESPPPAAIPPRVDTPVEPDTGHRGAAVPRPVPTPVPGAAPVPVPATSPGLAESVRRAASGAAAALAQVSPLTRIEPVAAPPTLDLERAAAELSAGRESALAIGLRVGLALLAGACALPVVRAIRRAPAEAAPVTVRRDRS